MIFSWNLYANWNNSQVGSFLLLFSLSWLLSAIILLFLIKYRLILCFPTAYRRPQQMCGLPHRREGNIHCLKPSQAPGPINPGKSPVSVPQHTYVRGMATSKGNCLWLEDLPKVYTLAPEVGIFWGQVLFQCFCTL